MITPNGLTVFRILIAVVCPPLLLSFRLPISDIAVILLFTIACITDWWDGHLARTKKLVSTLGKLLDPIADKLLILGLLISFVYLNMYGIEWIILILIREVVVTGVRFTRLQRGQVIPAEWAGKLKLGFQIGSISASLLYLTVLDGEFAVHMPLLGALAHGLHYAGIVLANVFTLTSGIKFFQRLD